MADACRGGRRSRQSEDGSQELVKGSEGELGLGAHADCRKHERTRRRRSCPRGSDEGGLAEPGFPRQRRARGSSCATPTPARRRARAGHRDRPAAASRRPPGAAWAPSSRSGVVSGHRPSHPTEDGRAGRRGQRRAPNPRMEVRSWHGQIHHPPHGASWRRTGTEPFIVSAVGAPSLAQEGSPDVADKPNIVLVHGAWADGSSWGDVIAPLQADGYDVTAVQLPLTSVRDDVATLLNVLSLQDGPTLVAAHSYGGFVISALPADAPNVIGLVYVAAFAPDEGETGKALTSVEPPPPGFAALRPDAAGNVWLKSPDGFLEFFMTSIRRGRWSSRRPRSRWRAPRSRARSRSPHRRGDRSPRGTSWPRRFINPARRPASVRTADGRHGLGGRVRARAAGVAAGRGHRGHQGCGRRAQRWCRLVVPDPPSRTVFAGPGEHAVPRGRCRAPRGPPPTCRTASRTPSGSARSPGRRR